MPDVIKEAQTHDWWWSDQNIAFRMIDEIVRLRELLDDAERVMLRQKVARLEQAAMLRRRRALLHECLPHFERGQEILWNRIRTELGESDERYR